MIYRASLFLELHTVVAKILRTIAGFSLIHRKKRKSEVAFTKA
jgi:hypothetical protein